VNIEGNLIGVAADGVTPLGNGSHGVSLLDPVDDVFVGGESAGTGNVIAFNGGHGVRLDSGSQNNAILRNSIYSNGGLGIDLQPHGEVNVNDPGDADSGANSGQNHPVLATAEAGSLHITGSFDSLAGSYRLEFFANDECDPLGHGEGQIFLGAGTATLPVPGGSPFEATLDADVATGIFVTVTATSLATADTSEFSNCVEVFSAATPTPTPPGQSPTPTPTATPPGQTPTPTPTATPPGQTQTPTTTATPPEQTPIATPTPTSPSETPTDSPDTPLWGDVDCSDGVDPVDSLKLLRFDAGLSVAQGMNCPPVGEPHQFNGSEELWGDIDCSDAVDPVDSLKALRHDAGLSVAQGSGCPPIGEPV
jgi:parallel beta-helix repeat protein